MNAFRVHASNVIEGDYLLGFGIVGSIEPLPEIGMFCFWDSTGICSALRDEMEQVEVMITPLAISPLQAANRAEAAPSSLRSGTYPAHDGAGCAAALTADQGITIPEFVGRRFPPDLPDSCFEILMPQGAGAHPRVSTTRADWTELGLMASIFGALLIWTIAGVVL